MKQTGNMETGQTGSIIMIVAIFLGLATLTIVSIMIATNNYSRINFAAHEYERAFELADTGLRATVQDLNSGRNGTIDAARGRQFFATSNAFRASNWQFTTAVSNTAPNRRRVVSTGLYGHARAVVTADVAQGSQAQRIHALYAHALYAGNRSRSTNYVLQIGGTGSGADYVVGDVYSGNNLAVSGDAKLRLPEAYVDANGNGIYDEGEIRLDSAATTYHSNALSQAGFNAYTSSVNRANIYANGQYTYGEAYVDKGNSTYDYGEAFTDSDGDGVWDVARPASNQTVRVNGRNRTISYPAVPAETFVDMGNGIYDTGETYFDDRNGRYDYGAQATGTITGSQTPGAGQTTAAGHSTEITPPDLSVMFYAQASSGTAPSGAANDWGSDVNVASGSFNSSGKIMNSSDPRHIFVKNPTGRTYTPVPGRNDYFLEDPTDASYGESHQYIDVNSNGNDMVYYVDGNVYIHNPSTYDFMFRDPGTKLTIVANGNITISDEFWYNGGTTNPADGLALIAMKNPAVTNSGNIYLGDAQFGTGGDIHAMLYAENNFVDNNLNTAGQPYLSVFGNMTAGNLVNINRGSLSASRTRLDVTLDERIVARRNLPPGLPQALSGQRSISVTGAWEVVKGTWYTQSPLL